MLETRTALLARREKQNKQPLSWPHSRLAQIQPAKWSGARPVERETYDSSRFLPGYHNGGMYPMTWDLMHRPPFVAQTNRAARRAQPGRYGPRRIGTLTARGALRVKPLEQVAAERALRLASRKLDRASA